ncbi:MAG: hypothetical protein E6J68_14910 [Deltaproteobacteria bacterium]|nr:MAG: hypothetical protein E6J68_14910 [Deltaproteobacteria bacterium]
MALNPLASARPRGRLDDATLSREVDAARARGIGRDARAVIQWAHDLLGDGLMMTTSFQKSGMIILHMLREIAPHLPVYFLDTGFHFPETLAFAERVRREWNVNLIFQRAKLFGEAFRAQHGKLYERDPDLCCHLNKVEPQAELLERYQGWIAGVRRDQADTREGAESLEILEGGTLRVQPLAHWVRSDVEAYLRASGRSSGVRSRPPRRPARGACLDAMWTMTATARSWLGLERPWSSHRVADWAM